MSDDNMLQSDTLNRLYRYCHSLTNDAAQAYDLLQDGIERYLKQDRAQIQHPLPYMHRLLRNRYIDLERQKQRYPADSLDHAEPELREQMFNQAAISIGTETLEQQTIAAKDLEPIWASLNPAEREILYLWAVEGMSASEIGDHLDMPRNTILSKIHRSRQKILKQQATTQKTKAQD